MSAYTPQKLACLSWCQPESVLKRRRENIRKGGRQRQEKRGERTKDRHGNNRGQNLELTFFLGYLIWIARIWRALRHPDFCNAWPHKLKWVQPTAWVLCCGISEGTRSWSLERDYGLCPWIALKEKKKYQHSALPLIYKIMNFLSFMLLVLNRLRFLQAVQ